MYFLYISRQIAENTQRNHYAAENTPEEELKPIIKYSSSFWNDKIAPMYMSLCFYIKMFFFIFWIRNVILHFA